jgi:gliding motility-associated-like protein
VVLGLPVITPQEDTSICLGNSALLHPNVTGASFFSWTPAAGLSNPMMSNPVATPVTTTQYILTAGNSGGCTTNDTVVVNVTPPLSHSPTQTIAICDGGSVKIGASIHPGNYLWSTGAATDSIAVSASGTYWVETSQSGCMVRDSFMITIAASSNIDFAYQQNMCSPKTIQFTTSLINPQSFDWNFGNSQINTTSQTPTVVYANYGSYPVKLVVQYVNGCKDSIQKNILVDNVFDNSLVVNSDTTICLGDSILLKTTGVISNYCWQTSTGINTTSLHAYVKPTTPTTYVLTSQVFGTNLVVNSDFSSGNTGFTSDYFYVSNNVTEGEYWVGNNPPVWNPGMNACTDHTSGPGNMMLVNGSPVAGARVWTQTIAVTPNTNYAFSTWLQSLYPQNPASLQFAINNFNLGNTISASGVACQWNQFSSVWNSGSNTTATITIVNNNTIAAGNDFALDDIFFGTVTTKTDSFKVLITGFCDSINLTGPDKICSPSDTLIYNIYKPANCTQQFTLVVDNAFANIIAQTATSVKLVFKQNGNTTIKVAYSNNCKTVVDSIPVTIKFSPPAINFGPDITGCRDTSLLLNAGNGFVTYVWQNGATDSTFQANVPGTYHVLAQNLCGIQLKDTIRIIKSGPVPFSVSPLNATVCAKDSVLFTASGGHNYQWQPSANFSSPTSSTTKAIIATSQNYIIHISDTVCLRDTLVTIPVVASSAANIQLTKTNDVNCSRDSSVLKASGGVSYVWSPNLFIVRTTTGQITVKPTQTLVYYVDGTDALGCKGRDSITVAFTKEGDQLLYMPDAFSPNGDGINDVFRPKFIGPAAKYEFNIYNRWGQLIFRSTTPGVGWDGKYKSKDQPQDVFVYYVKAEGGCNGKFEMKGTFILIR